MHRQHQDQEIRHDAKHGIGVPRIDQIVAMAWLLLVPCLVDGDALEDSRDSCRDCEECYDGEQAEDQDPVDAMRHDAEVEKKD